MAANDWSAILEQNESKVKQARKAGDVDALIELTQDVLRQIDDRLAEVLPGDEKTRTLQAAKRIGFNVAADVYPGWELDTPPRSPAQLNAASAFAGKSALAVGELGLGAAQQGNAIWLLAALDLARGDRSAAIAGFEKAAAIFGQGPEPEMRLMALGYATIASNSPAEFDTVIAGLKNLGSEDAGAFQAQLDLAARIFKA